MRVHFSSLQSYFQNQALRYNPNIHECFWHSNTHSHARNLDKDLLKTTFLHRGLLLYSPKFCFGQKYTHSLIDAVEIDGAACQQATENMAATAWADRMTVFNTDILTFDPGKQYDCIISNPPFFTDHLKSPDAKKNNAKHNTTLELTALLKSKRGNNFVRNDRFGQSFRK